jgi:predicted chitinase
MALGWLTENGWPSCAAQDCDHSNVPGTDISIPIQIGIPNTILKGFLAALNEHIEPFNGPQDQGGWTPDNKVATSNHLGGTATDFNWDDHPMGVADDGWDGSTLIKGDEVPAVRELLDYCEGMVWWGNDWDSPKDSMHFQMGYNTYNNIPKCMDFIHRKVDPATMKLRWVPSWKGGAPPPPPAPAPADTPVQVLYEAVEAFGMDDATKWLGQITAGLTLSQCTNPKRIAGWLAEIGEESGDFVYTEEINKSGPYAPYIGRTWIQITWQTNYAAFGAWAAHQGLVDDPNTFVANPASLADPKWAGVGAAWYWTVARASINSLCDAGDLTSVTKLINGSGASQATISNRQARYDHAIALGDRLLLLIAQPNPPVPPPTPAPTTGVIDLANVPQDEWDELVADVKEIRAQLNGDAAFDTGKTAAAVKRVEDIKNSGKPLSLLDMVTWLKNHASTHKNPTP